MNCKIVRSVTQDYLDGRLVGLDRNEFVHHVDLCATCEDEVLAYREIFVGLNSIEKFEAPSGLETVVMASLREQGLVYEQKVPMFRRLLDGFLRLPAIAKYPLAAATVITALYMPVALVLSRASSSVGAVTGFVSNAFQIMQTALGNVTVASRVLDTLGSYAKAFATVFQACLSLASSSAGDNVLFLSIGSLTALIAVVLSVVSIRKRNSHDAPSVF